MDTPTKATKRYRILKTLLLGFWTPRSQWDALISPREGATLECDGETVWLINKLGRWESISEPSSVLKPEFVEEIEE